MLLAVLLALVAVLRGAAAGTAPALPQLAVNDFIWSTYLKDKAPEFFVEFAPAEQGMHTILWHVHMLPQPATRVDCTWRHALPPPNNY